MNTLKPEYQQALGEDFNNLTDICHLSFEELRKKVKDKLSWSQTQSLYLEAQQVQKDNRLHEARILKRANPQLQNAIHSALKTSQNDQAKKEKDEQDQESYNSKFGNRASKYAAPGAVSSMFSPAAYLTELYRQARDLHDEENSDYHLDTRRPDLKLLKLRQENMNTEISALSLSNKVLLEGIQTLSKNKLLEGTKTPPKLDSHTDVMKTLSAFRPSGSIPYHDAYESMRKIIQLQAPVFEQSSESPEIAKLMYQTSLLGINASVSPELFNILMEKITDDEMEIKRLYRESFGDIEPSLMATPEKLKSYYNLTDQEVSLFTISSKISQQEYSNHKLIASVVNSNGQIKTYRITRQPKTPVLNISLFPLGGENYKLSCKKNVPLNISRLLIKLNGEKLRGEGNPFEENEEYTTNIKLSTTIVKLPIEFSLEIEVIAPQSGSFHQHTSSTKFTFEEYDYPFLLKLNKVILLSKATGLSPTLFLSINPELNIDAEVLEKVFRVKYYMQRYGIDAETALTLCKAPISQPQPSNDNHPSQFDRLFNSPKLNGQNFAIGSNNINLNPDSPADWRKAVLKRAFNVDDISLNRLLKITNPVDTTGIITNDIENLSHLYRTKLLADIHQLTIDELGLLLVAIGEKETNLSIINNTALATLIDKLYDITSWLRTQKWSVYQLFVMTTDKYNETLTPEIHNLLDTIYNGLQNFYKDNLLKIKDNLLKAKESLPEDKDNLPGAEKYLLEAEKHLLAAEKYLLESKKNPLEVKKNLEEYEKNQGEYEKNLKEHEKYLLKAGENLPAIKENLLKIKENLPKAISPYIAAALQLPSENVAYSVLIWTDKLAGEEKVTVEKFWQWLRKNPVTAQPEFQTQAAPAIQYCQNLAQLALIYRFTGLSENMFHLFVTKPQLFGIKAKTAPTHATLITLTRFADWVNSLGEKASSILTEFEKGTLEVKQLADVMNLDKNLLEQAKTQAQAHDSQIINENAFSNWTSLSTILQWVNITHQLNISPQGVSTLAQVLTAESPVDYTQWENVAAILTAGLDTQKANALHAFLDESRSTALSTYYIYAHNQKDLQDRKDAVIKNRDELYQYLLIDNQVSAAIKTTEIAEAIASIQLYVNRALKNMEGGIVTSVTSRPFFKDWDKYNKHYSTWAGISKLAYYPENYIDPTMRIGQTKMMDALLQSISQSQLNTDTVEDAFKSYLTSFEQVANLEVISAYHDNINNDQGLTYFIGHSKTDVNQYYWRNVDHNKFSESKFPANAWSEWHKIDCPINPYKDTIRPVIYQSRLYIIWLEEKRIATHEGGKTTESFRYELKLAHIRYDGTWNTPITFDANSKIDVHSKISDLTLGKNEAPGLYCASYQGKDKLLVMFYKKQEELNKYTDKAPIKGLYITSNMSPEEMTPENYRPNSHKQFDTNNVIRVNNRYAESYEIPSSVNSNNGYDWGKDYLSMVYGGNISAINLESQSSNLKIKFSPRLRIIHNGLVGRQRNQCNLMKKYGKLGDKFIIYTTLGINSNNLSNKKFIYPVYQYSGGEASKLSQGRLLFYRESTTNFVRAWFPNLPSGSQEMSTTTGDNISGNYGYIENKHSNDDPFKAYFYMDDHGGIDTDVSGILSINTDIKHSKVKVIVKAAGITEETFVADQNNNVPTNPPLSFEEMNYQFKELEIDISKLAFHNNEASIDVTFTASAEAFKTSTDTEASESDKKERHLGEEHFSIRIIKKANVDDVLTLHHDANGAQYMQWGVYRTRLNTLFARKLISRANAGIDTILSMDTQNIQEPKLGESSPNAMEPTDFSGANSLYFWELFYYTPMLIAQRLLHEQNFDEANRWLKYVWNPSGYIKHDQIQDYHWNVRPLQEDTSWNDDPLDSVDPDAIAQHDPMHYKVATFMRTLDLLMARGDYAYRQLERDTLNEAKMWYMQALHLLGDKPHLSLNSTWDDQSLSDAANPERQKEHSRAIAALQKNDFGQHDKPTDLFLPQANEVMLNYWQTLEQRLYNLRHNLSIDGQPLHLPIYATPADPKALLSAAVASSQGGSSLPPEFMSLWRFPHMLENARGMVSQLIQFGSTLQSIIERQDAEALNTLLQNQAAELILTNLSVQDKTIEELDAEETVLEKTRLGAQSRFNSYSKLYDENINSGERQALDMRVASQSITAGLKGLHMAAAALDMVPNIYGMAVGGSHYGAIANAIAIGGGIAADGLLIEADKVSQSEIWRRRRQEWEIQRNNAQAELKQIDAQLGSLTVRREAAVLQKTSLKTQQEQTHAQLTFLQRKFSNQALFNWLRGRLAAIYFQFYDLAVSRCLMAEMAYRWETNETNTSFIKPGAWQGTHAGLLAGETLMLNLAQMEDAHLRQDQRVLEVERTISLAEIYAKLPQDKFTLTQEIEKLVSKGSGSAGKGNNKLEFGANTKTSLEASISLADLQICKDYPEDSGVGNVRRIKQISVTLPALLGPYQDVQAVLSCKEAGLAKGCEALAVSHGMNDSGQFQLDFNDGKFLPFEGIDVDQGTLTLSFPNATGKQKTMLESLSDIILHIRYTIRQ
ncbi:Tc toxin subunit A-related protein [Photorhabdus thracensis]|uniref:Tc toxin subunit A-related protein n=1 Tax=Photorhabdus thracensis TaxID=230089 RepID=UPI001E34EA8D|nr:neuraminidase-like domain-containing protein [Photorhabdus thracensis]